MPVTATVTVALGNAFLRGGRQRVKLRGKPNQELPDRWESEAEAEVRKEDPRLSRPGVK